MDFSVVDPHRMMRTDGSAERFTDRSSMHDVRGSMSTQPANNPDMPGVPEFANARGPGAPRSDIGNIRTPSTA